MYTNFEPLTSDFSTASKEAAFCLTLLQQILEEGTCSKLWDVTSLDFMAESDIEDSYDTEINLGYCQTVNIEGVSFDVSLYLRRPPERLTYNGFKIPPSPMDLQLFLFVYQSEQESPMAEHHWYAFDAWGPAAVVPTVATKVAHLFTY